MTTRPPEEPPKFIRNATSTQKWMAGIAVSMFITVWISGWAFVVDIFKPDFVKALTYTRMTIALVGICITSIVGYEQIKKMMDWIVDSWEVYKKISEFKKNKEK